MTLENVRETPGYLTGFHMESGDVGSLKAIISNHLSDQLRGIAPDQVDLFKNTPLERYHEIADRLPHTDLLTRTARILPQAAVDEIRKMSLLRQLRDEFGDFAISDEEDMGRESISIRLVRPNVATDIGSLHADHWFWELYKFPVPKGLQRVKVWMAICCEPGKSGLLLSPDSHTREWKYNTTERVGMLKPLLDPSEKPELELFQSQPGDAVAFNYHLLHGGTVTRGELTRVSMEFTMLIPDEIYFKKSAPAMH